MITRRWLGSLAAASLFFSPWAHAAEGSSQDRLAQIVNEAIRPVMEESNIPGMAVAVTIRGKRSFFNYGVAKGERTEGQ